MQSSSATSGGGYTLPPPLNSMREDQRWQPQPPPPINSNNYSYRPFNSLPQPHHTQPYQFPSSSSSVSSASASASKQMLHQPQSAYPGPASRSLPMPFSSHSQTTPSSIPNSNNNNSYPALAPSPIHAPASMAATLPLSQPYHLLPPPSSSVYSSGPYSQPYQSHAQSSLPQPLPQQHYAYQQQYAPQQTSHHGFPIMEHRTPKPADSQPPTHSHHDAAPAVSIHPDRLEFEKTASVIRNDFRRASMAQPSSKISNEPSTLPSTQDVTSVSQPSHPDPSPSLTSDSPVTASQSAELPVRRKLPPYQPIPEKAVFVPHPDTSKVADVQRNFMSSLYLADDPDAALRPFLQHAKQTDSLVQLINTPLLRTGETPLHIAAKWGRPHTMRRLLAYGASPRLRTGFTCHKFPCTRSQEQPTTPPPSATSSVHDLPGATSSTGRPQRKRKAAPKEFKPEASPPLEPATTTSKSETASSQQIQCLGCQRIESVHNSQTKSSLFGPQTALQILMSNPSTTMEWIESNTPGLLKQLISQFGSVALLDRTEKGFSILHQAIQSNDTVFVESVVDAIDESTVSTLMTYTDVYGKTPIHTLCENPNPDIASIKALQPHIRTAMGYEDGADETPLDICVRVAKQSVQGLGLFADEVEALKNVVYDTDDGMFRRSLVAATGGMGATDTASTTSAKKHDTAFLVRRMFLIAAEGEYSLKKIAAARLVAKLLLENWAAGSPGTDGLNVKEFFDSKLEIWMDG